MTTSTDPIAAVAAASIAFEASSTSTIAERARWLRAAADALEAEAPTLIALADEESHLGPVRLRAELTRTVGQLAFFGRVIEEGSYLEATIDHAAPGATPPRPDLRRMLVPLGPVAIFTASNFPFAFSVAGGDTASAVAAGCSVVVKGHSAHPRLSARTFEIVRTAFASAGAPEGILGHISGQEAGRELVRSAPIAAVGFTGSRHAGRSLFDLASSRPDPIPFYGELSAVNPVILTRAAVEARGAELAAGLVGSFTGSAGQYCTKPGVVLVPSSAGFEELLAEALGEGEAAAMLTESIAAAYFSRIDALTGNGAVRVVAGRRDSDVAGAAFPLVLAADAASAVADAGNLLDEAFGPVTLLLAYRDLDEALAVLEATGGSLTASLHAEPGESIDALLPRLTRVAGRVLFDGWPTGVAVSWAQTHAGPWPATTSSMHTSVGATAIRRWLRPLSYQSAPAAVLPPALADGNPLGIPRRVDGRLGES